MASTVTTTESTKIPRRPSFRSSEVCQIAGIKPYVLRSWEQEIANLGKGKGDGPRVYRRADVERVLRLKQLTYKEGLTLAGARRRLEEEQDLLSEADERHAASVSPTPGLRKKLTEIKKGLRGILEILTKDVKSSGPMKSAKSSRQGATGHRKVKAVKRKRTRR